MSKNIFLLHLTNRHGQHEQTPRKHPHNLHNSDAWQTGVDKFLVHTVLLYHPLLTNVAWQLVCIKLSLNACCLRPLISLFGGSLIYLLYRFFWLTCTVLNVVCGSLRHSQLVYGLTYLDLVIIWLKYALKLYWKITVNGTTDAVVGYWHHSVAQ